MLYDIRGSTTSNLLTNTADVPSDIAYDMKGGSTDRVLGTAANCDKAEGGAG